MNYPDDDASPLECSTCSGTGIPYNGPPDKGFCKECNGTGVSGVSRKSTKWEQDEPDAYEVDDDTWQSAQDRWEKYLGY